MGQEKEHTEVDSVWSEKLQMTDLIKAAAAGDPSAANEFFAANFGLLNGLARKIAGGAYPADDLLAEALLKLLEKWRTGQGPTGNIVGYLAVSMRNRMKDFYKSPRSKDLGVDNEFQTFVVEEAEFERIDLHADLQIVRNALDDLPADQRQAIIATVIDGEKPADLQSKMGRAASSIYSLKLRAKANLRKKIFLRVLQTDAPVLCAANASKIEEIKSSQFEDLPESEAKRHIRECSRCWPLWRRFSTIAALGVAPIVVLSNDAFPPSAGAVESRTEESSESDSSSKDKFSSNSERPVRPSRSMLSSSTGKPWLALGLIFAGIVTATVGIFTFVSRPSENNNYAGDFLVTPTLDEDGVAKFDVSLAPAVTNWEIDSIKFHFTRSPSYAESPDGWLCKLDDATVVCSSDESSPAGGVFEMAFPKEIQSLHYEVQAIGTTSGNLALNGTSSGEVRRTL